MSIENTSMKNVALLIATLFLAVQVTAQCPDGSIVLTNQSEVDQFLLDYPDCSEIQGSLTINSGFGEPITDLTPLSGITEITDSLVLLKLDYFDPDLEETVVTSLNGLDNLVSAGNVYIGNPDPVPSPPNLFNSLAPLNNLSGSVGAFWLSKVEITEPLPEFPNLESIDYFRFSNVSGVTATPAFTGLTTIRDFTVSQSGPVPNDVLTTVIIPESLESVTSENNPESSEAGVYIFSCGQVAEIVGGGSLLEILGDVSITNVPELNDLDGFNNVSEVTSIAMNVCQNGGFDGFYKLQEADNISLTLQAQLCDGFEGNAVNIPFGQSAGSLNVVGPPGLYVLIEGVEEIAFTGIYNGIGKLEIVAPDANTISGFGTLEQISGSSGADLVLNAPNIASLPAFDNLTIIEGALRLMSNPAGAPWLLTDLTGLESLTSLGSLFIGPIAAPADHNLASLSGLSSLTEITGNITVRNLPNMSNVEAFGTSLDFAGNFTLQNLPLLENCDESPVICHLASSAESVSLSGNGTDCDEGEQWLADCISVGIVENVFVEPDVTMYFDNQSQLHLKTTRDGDYELVLYDPTGKIFFSQEIYLTAGHRVIPVPGGLSDGIYLAHWTNGVHRGSKKLFYTAK